MKKMFLLAVIGLFSVVYLWCMNSTENRQRLEEESSASYVGFRNNLRVFYPQDSDDMVYKCYSAYNSLVHMRPNSDCCDQCVKDKLVKIGYCDLDDGSLVLKGFHIEDTISVLVGRVRINK
jgi:hypothetical protein